MAGIREGMRVVEGSAFVAAPFAVIMLGQLGADVIRFDPILMDELGMSSSEIGKLHDDGVVAGPELPD
jgi:crotonobetainyl-CoA:carnitine CoA-transferase CaiB-like acyl-CoA transferase